MWPCKKISWLLSSTAFIPNQKVGMRGRMEEAHTWIHTVSVICNWYIHLCKVCELPELNK